MRVAPRGLQSLPQFLRGLVINIFLPAVFMSLLCLLRLLLITLPFPNAFPSAELQTLVGQTLVGDLQELSSKSVVLRVDNGLVTVPVTEILQLNLQAVGGPAPASANDKITLVVLTDGSQIHCQRFRLEARNAALTLAATAEPAKQPWVLTVPLSVVAYFLNDAQDPAVRQEWQEKFLAKRGKEDLVVIKAKNGLSPLSGTLGDGTGSGDKIQFRLAGRDYAIPLAQIHGAAFVRRENEHAPAVLCRLHDVHRNVLAVAAIELTGDRFVLTTVCGVKVEYPRSIVARLDFSGDKLAYLSDLEPVRVEQRSSLGRIEPYRRDKNLDDGPLRLAGEKFAKGLALHAYTELVYNLEGKYKEFRAVLGIDDLVGGDGQPLVTIEGDGRLLFKSEISRTDAPRLLKLNIEGVRLLRIVVAAQGILDVGAHVDLADAKVSK